jgi:hypothetical protein
MLLSENTHLHNNKRYQKLLTLWHRHFEDKGTEIMQHI